MKDLRHILSTHIPTHSDESSNLGPEPVPIRIEQALFIDLACAAWKLHQQIFDQATGQPKEELRQLARHVTVICDRFSELGLQIQDHTAEPFDSGQSLEVLAFQPTKGISRETVLETIRPTIYFSGRRILMGQVIVGTPEESWTGEGKI